MKYLYTTLILTALSIYSGGALSAGIYDTRNDELEVHDMELNSAYKNLMNTLDANKQKHLREAQRAWLVMRDNDCKWAFVDIRDCLIDRTINRTSELTKSWYQTKDGKYRSLR